MSGNGMVKLVAGGIFGILAFIIFLMTYFTVDQNEMTVVTRFGEMQYVADPGLHFKMPFVNSTTAYRTDIQSIAPNAAVNTYTVDNQEVDVIFTIFYRVPPTKVAYIFANNRDYQSRIMSLAVDRLKAAMGQVNVQLVAEKRGALRDTIKATLEHDLEPMGVEVTDFQLTDMQYTQAYRQAINNAAVQKANVESAEYNRQAAEKAALQAKVQAIGLADAARENARGEADARVLNAKASADARLLQATAEAKAIQLQGEAQATAIKAQADALAANKNLVELRKAEKWDGKLPVQMLSSVTPFMSFEAAK